MANRQNVTVQGQQAQVASDEAEILINAGDKDLVITIKDYLTVGGIETAKGNLTLATTHGNVVLPNNQNLSINLWMRGASSKPRRNVTIK